MDFHHESVTTSLSFETVLRIIYPTQDKYRIATAIILGEIIKKGELDGYEIAQICEQHKIPKATWHKIFVKLRRLGLIDRRNMKYYPNTEFSSALRRLGDSWKKIVEEKKVDFDPVKLSLNT